MQRGVIKRLGDQTVDVQLAGSAATLPGVLLSDQIDRSALVVGAAVLVDLVEERAVVLHTLAGEQSTSSSEQPLASYGSGVINNALLSDGSVPLMGSLVVAPGVLIDGYDISVLGQTIDNLQAADSVARTGHTVLTHASHLVATLGPDDTEVLVRHGIFKDKETLMVSNTMGEVETMRVVGNPVTTVDDRGALCYRYTVTRRTATNPPGIVTGWAAATLVNGLTHKGFISVDARETSVAAPNLRFVMHTDIDAGATEQIFRMGNLYGILGNNQTDFGFATGRLNTGDRYLAYNYSRNRLALRGADIAVSDDAGVDVFRVWAVAEDDHQTGDARLGHPSGGNIQTVGSDVDFYAGGQRVLSLTPLGSRFRGMIWSGTQPGPQVGIGEENGQGLIAARNAAGVGQFVVRTGDENVHVHMGNPVTEGGYAQFVDGEFTTDGIVRARAFELLGGGTINPGSTLTNAGKFTAGTGNSVAVIDGEDVAWRIYAGHATPASAPFRVNQAGEAWLTNAHVSGEINATAGVFGGWTLNSTYLAKDTGVANTSAGLAPNDYPFYAGATYANRATAPFRVTQAGAMTATAGNIAGWTIASGHLYAGSGVSRTGLQPATYPFYAGSETPSAAPFRVTQSGSLTATSATITGTINAAAGNITGSLFVGASGYRLHLDGANKRFESTNFASGTSGFRIEGETGNAEFNNVTVRGVLAATAIQYGYVLATNGSIWVVKAAGRSLNSFSVPKEGIGTLDIEDPDGMTHAAAGGLWAVNDVIRLQEPLAGDFWGVVTAKTDMATYWQLAVEQRSIFGNGTFPAGAAVLNYGQSGDGVVRITADASNSPYISIATHAGSPWTTLTERARLGNLTGISGASGYGLWTDNGYFTGAVNASAGAIGGWTIASSHLYAGSGSNRVGLNPPLYPFYAGSEAPSTAPFRVSANGFLVASNANIAGTVTASAGNIAGWTLAATKLYWEDPANFRGIGLATYDDAGGYAFWAGDHRPAYAEFRVSKSGALWATTADITGTITANAGSISGWTIASGHLYAGSGTARAGMQPASYPFYAGSETPASAPFRVTPAGALTASNATVTGTITANAGSIAGWTIASGHLYAGSGAARAGMQPASYPFYAGSETPASAPFRVTPAGALTASNATVSGTITANAGSMAGWTIASGHLYAGSGSSRAGLQPASYPFYAGSDTPSSAPFRVTPAGALTATSGVIGGWTLSGTKLSSSLLQLDAANNKIHIGSTYFHQFEPGIVELAGDFRVTGALAADVGFGCTGFSAYGSSFWHTGNLLGFYGATPVTRPAAYTFSNGVTDRTINCNSTTVDELADVVYTLWSDLRSLGLLQ
jgi:hypothetical protein